MIVRLRAFGELERLFGGERPHLSLPDPATLGDLLDVIDERWGALLGADLVGSGGAALSRPGGNSGGRDRSA